MSSTSATTLGMTPARAQSASNSTRSSLPGPGRMIGCRASRRLCSEDPAAWRGQALTLTGRAAVDFGELAAILSACLRRPIAYDPASILGYAWHLRRRRRLEWMQILVQTVLHVGLRRGDAEAVDPTVERVLGRPARSVAEYVEAASAAWQPS